MRGMKSTTFYLDCKTSTMVFGWLRLRTWSTLCCLMYQVAFAKVHHMQQGHHMVQFYPNRSEQEEAFRQKD